jgi:hypothetical protein
MGPDARTQAQETTMSEEGLQITDEDRDHSEAYEQHWLDDEESCPDRDGDDICCECGCVLLSDEEQSRLVCHDCAGDDE